MAMHLLQSVANFSIGGDRCSRRIMSGGDREQVSVHATPLQIKIDICKRLHARVHACSASLDSTKSVDLVERCSVIGHNRRARASVHMVDSFDKYKERLTLIHLNYVITGCTLGIEFALKSLIRAKLCPTLVISCVF